MLPPTSRARSNTFPVPYPQYVVQPTVLSVLYSLSLYPTLPINTLSPPILYTPNYTPGSTPVLCLHSPISPPSHFITPYTTHTPANTPVYTPVLSPFPNLFPSTLYHPWQTETSPC